MIICPKCLQEKPDEAFAICSYRESGRQFHCRACRREARIALRLTKPPGWVRKTADIVAYRKAYREENRARLSAVESEWKKADRKKNPERWRKKYREKYRRQQMKIHGDGWKPRKRLTAVERSENRNAAARKKYRRWREIHPEQYLAKLAVKAALKVGRLVKQPCSVCGDPKGQAHHPDYSAPLEVVWLCDAHHRQAHRESKK